MNNAGSILVTGGAGFIGSHTSLLLLERGYRIIIVDSFINSYPESLKRIEQILKTKNYKFDNQILLYKGCLTNKDFIYKVFSEVEKKGININAVIHFAGLKSVGDSISNSISYYEQNVISIINLLLVMQSFFCRTIVFSSSATIYKSQGNKLLNEECELKAINPYAQTKIVIERILSDLYKSQNNNWRIMNLRYFNPIGAHPSGLIGESPKGFLNNLFPLILEVASKSNYQLKIFGNNWPTKDGTCIRDYIHVMDLAEGHIKALEFLKESEPNIYSMNLGTGKGTSVMDLINIFESINNVKIDYVISGRRIGDLPFLVADNRYAKKLLNWNPSRTLEKMCADGWNWKIRNPDGYNF
tara:strand:- start:422 stop:1489 length:1068 start_codon:yes stop_codon:yes gene_type:complete